MGHASTLYVVGTFDTKGAELRYMAEVARTQGADVVTVDLSTSGRDAAGPTSVTATEVAAHHPGGVDAVFGGDRGASISAMSKAFVRFVSGRDDIGAMVSAGGSGGTALVTPALRALAVGTPKMMVSTVASGNVEPYVGASDIAMMYSVTDVQGLNRISRQILANAANAAAGMAMHRAADIAASDDKPGLGMTMFGVTTTAVQQLTALLEDDYECLVFHATGTGGRSMEKLVDSHLLTAAIDLTTTEVCDMMMDGVFAANEDRFGAFIRSGVPYVGSVGALDMVNFGAPDAVPVRYVGRTFYEHNAQVTLMRTTPEENAKMGNWIASRLNEMTGPVRFFLPEGGVSAIDSPGQPFHDPAADAALFDALSSRFVESGQRRLVRLPHHINDAAFTDAVAAGLRDIA